jgi:hypothetical protein
MADEIKVEYERRGYQWPFIKLTMTNARGTTYLADIFKQSASLKLGPGLVTNAATGVSIWTRSAPKWVQRTINEQIPIVAILFS